MTSAATSSVVHELIERAGAASGREQALAQAFSVLQREVGFDCASAVSLEGAAFLAFDKPAICHEAWRCNGPRYLAEGRHALSAARALGGVVRDRDAWSARERAHAMFYNEYMAPLGASGFLLILVQFGRTPTQLLSLTRVGSGSFRDGELDTVRALCPALSLVARAFSGVAREPAPAHEVARRLSPREAEIVGYLARGLQNAEIAACLGTSRHTVRNQLQRLFRKLEVSTRAELVALAVASGWTPGLSA